MNTRIPFGAMLGGLLLAWRAGAVPPAPDGWGEIFARFDAYGLPDVSTADYVCVRACGELLPDEWETSGNAWRTAEVRDEQGQPVRMTAVVEGSRTFDVVWREVEFAELLRKHATLAMPAPKATIVSSTWSAGDAGRDARKGAQFIDSLKWEGDEVWLHRYPGRLFLLAYGLWQRGDATNATILLEALARRAGGAEDAAREAMNLVANGEYENLYRAFRADPDWTAYRDGIRRLLEKYPEGWTWTPAVRHLLEKVEARLADPAALPAGTAEWSETDRAQAAAMAGLRRLRGGEDVYTDPPVLWIAPSGWREQVQEPLDAEMAVRVRGLAAVPFLLALMEGDDLLTEADRAEVGKDGPYRDRLDPPTLAERNARRGRAVPLAEEYALLDRPATRGEVARRWLREMLPEWVMGGDGGRLSNDELAQKAREFYAAHGAATEAEWAVLSLPGRYAHSFNDLAVVDLLARARQGAVPELENFLLEEKWPVPDADDYGIDSARANKAELLMQYAAIRGPAARPLVQEFAAQARRQAEAFAAPQKNEQQEKRAREQEKALRAVADKLETLPLDCPVERRKICLADGQYDRALVDAKLQEAPLADVLGEVLAHAVSLSAADDRGGIAHQIARRAGKDPAPGLRATDHAAAWETLIADDRRLSCDSERLASEVFLILNEQLFAQGNLPSTKRDSWDFLDANVGGRAARQLLWEHGASGRAWLRDRVRQRLAGAPEAELPRYLADVPLADDKLAALRDEFEAAADGATARKLVAELSPAERLALPDLLRREPELNARLLEWNRRIDAVQIDGDLGEWSTKLRAWEGRPMAPDLLEDLRSCAEERARAELAFSAKLVRRPDFGGCALEIATTVPVPEYYERNGAEQRIVGYAGLICGPGCYGAAFWRTAPPPDKENWWPVATSDSFEMRGFQTAVDMFFGAVLPASEEAFAVIQTQGEKR